MIVFVEELSVRDFCLDCQVAVVVFVDVHSRDLDVSGVVKAYGPVKHGIDISAMQISPIEKSDCATAKKEKHQ